MEIKRKSTLKLLAFILSVLMLIVSMPLTAFALALDSLNDSTDTPSTSPKDIIVLEEDKALREENVKHFKLSNGTTKAVIYPGAVHYKDANGNWIDIDNALTLNGSEYSTSNKSKIKFATKSGSNCLISIKDGEYKIDFTPLNTNKVNVAIENPQKSNSRKFEDLSRLNSLVSMATYANIYDGIDLEYILAGNNVKENIIVKEKQDSYTFAFELKLNKLSAMLENGAIILTDADTGEQKYKIPTPYMYDANGVYSNGVEYSLVQESKWKYTLTVIASADWINEDERAFPVTIDPAIGVVDDDVISVIVNENDEIQEQGPAYMAGYGYKTYIKLNSLPSLPNSAYLVSADVNLYYCSGDEAIIYLKEILSSWNENSADNVILSSNPTDYVKTQELWGGEDDSNPRYNWNITELANSWYNGGSNYGFALEALDETTGAYFGNVDYGYESREPLISITYRDMKGAEPYWSFISQSAGNAGTGSINLATGNLLFEISTPSTTDSLFSFTPSLIYNSAIAGEEYKYSNAQIGYWGTYVANGFKANFNEALIKDSYINSNGDSETYYIWADSDGTEHYFIKDSEGVYRDEDGLQLTLSTNDNDITQNCIITDSAHNQRIFAHMSGTVSSEIEATWYLSKLRDPSGNELYFQIDGSKKPNDIKIIPNGQNAITMISPLYNANSRLALLWNNSSKEGVVFRHSTNPKDEELSTNGGKYLREAIYIKCESNIGWSYVMNNFLGDFDNQTDGITVNAIMQYSYDPNGYLTEAHDTLSGYKIKYTYDDGQVTGVTEYGKNGTQGQTIGINYETGYTEVHTSGSNDIYGDNDDIINVYVFDNQGRTITTYSTNEDRTEIYGASSGEYVTDNENAKNSLKQSAISSDVSPNYLTNGNFEFSDTDLPYWSTTQGNVALTIDNGGYGWDNGSVTLSTANNSIASISQNVFLYPGEYTLLLDINASRTSNSTIFLKATSKADATKTFIERVASDEYLASGAQNFAFLTFEVDGAWYLQEYTIEISLQGSESEDIVIDNVMLSKSNGAQPYNLVSDGGFDNTTVFPYNAENIMSVGKWKNSNQYTGGATVTLNDGKNLVLSVNGTLQSDNSVGQVIYQASESVIEAFEADGNTGTKISTKPAVFVVSGFGKATNAMSGDNSTFALRLDAKYLKPNGTQDTETKYFSFNPASKNWQYVNGVYSVPEEKKLLTELKISCEYSGNIGMAYFDNVSVILNDSNTVEEYEYYDNGKLKLVTNDDEVTFYTYNENGNVLDIVTMLDWTHYNYNNADNPNQITSVESYGRIGIPPHSISSYDSFLLTLKASSDLLSVTVYEYNQYGLVTKTIVKDETDSQSEETEEENKTITTSYTYNVSAGSRIFGSVYSETNTLGDVTRYSYDTSNGRLIRAWDSSEGYIYTYDNIGNLVTVTPTSAPSEYKVDYDYTSANELEKVIVGDMNYIFTYDNFGNQSSVWIGENKLISYEYNSGNGKLKKVVYENGIEASYEYDKLERVSKITYTDTTKTENNKAVYLYEYDSNGNINKVTDTKNSTALLYKYDTDGKLITVIESNTESNINTSSTRYLYDTYSRVTGITYRQDMSETEIATQSYSYIYNRNGTLKEMNIAFNLSGQKSYRIEYNYDSLERFVSKELEMSEGTTIKSNQGYVDNGNNTSLKISMYETIVEKSDETTVTETYFYEYDINYENIVAVRNESGELLQSYKYDVLDRLVRVNDSITEKTYVYEYDINGNILSETQYSYTTQEELSTLTPTYTTAYGYTNPDWKDQLTLFDGAIITYDEMGNPTGYWDGNDFTWENGSNLASVHNSPTGKTTYYEYNSNGIRTSKTVDGVKHTYILDGSRIISERYSNIVIYYIYDESGSPIGLSYKSGNSNFENYFFTKNLQGDIINIYTEQGELAVSYKYDAWGKVISMTTETGYSHISSANCILYRGYYYDFETQYYYLNARYYDTYTKRFISADSVISGVGGNTNGYNLYVYCFDNPVNYSDYNGHLAMKIGNGVIISPSIARAPKNAEVAGKLLQDILNYDKDNKDVEKVYESNYFSSYNEVFVIRHSIDGLGSWAIFRTIFLTHKEDNDTLEEKSNTLNHEYGHILQERELGTGRYFVQVAIPSVIGCVLYNSGNDFIRANYFNLPWERDADRRGNVTRDEHTPESIVISFGYFLIWEIVWGNTYRG